MVDVTAFATNLMRVTHGIWVAPNLRDVSYPVEGNDACFAVEENSFWFKHRNDVITKLVKEFSAGETFFDVGGGNGFVALALQNAGVDSVLVEPGPQGARNAMDRGVATVIQSTLQDAGFKPASIAAVGIFDVLEHIEDDDDFLRSIHSYLRPGGRLYLTVPAYQLLWSRDDEYAGHFRRYTRRSLIKRLNASGFSVTYCGYLFAFLVPAIFIFRSIPSRLGFRRCVAETTSTVRLKFEGDS